LALYGETAIIAAFLKPAPLISYLESYLSDLERWLRERRIAINVSKRTVMLFAKTCRRFPKPQTVQLRREPIHCIDTARYLGVTLDTLLTRLLHIDQRSNEVVQRQGVSCSLLNRKSGLSIRTEYCFISSSFVQ
jgi:hypothetical protein